jgi:hypothetical protein
MLNETLSTSPADAERARIRQLAADIQQLAAQGADAIHTSLAIYGMERIEGDQVLTSVVTTLKNNTHTRFSCLQEGVTTFPDTIGVSFSVTEFVTPTTKRGLGRWVLQQLHIPIRYHNEEPQEEPKQYTSITATVWQLGEDKSIDGVISRYELSIGSLGVETLTPTAENGFKKKIEIVRDLLSRAESTN